MTQGDHEEPDDDFDAEYERLMATRGASPPIPGDPERPRAGVPVGYLTLADSVDALCRALKPHDQSADHLAFRELALRALLGALARHDLTAVVQRGQDEHYVAVRAASWRQVAAPRLGASARAEPKFEHIVRADRLIGDAFAELIGERALLARPDVDRLCSERRVKSAEPRPAQEEGDSLANVPVGGLSIKQWLRSPLVDRTARERCTARGLPDNEQTVRRELAQMLAEQGRHHDWQSLQADRRAAGFKTR